MKETYKRNTVQDLENGEFKEVETYGIEDTVELYKVKFSIQCHDLSPAAISHAKDMIEKVRDLYVWLADPTQVTMNLDPSHSDKVAADG